MKHITVFIFYLKSMELVMKLKIKILSLEYLILFYLIFKKTFNDEKICLFIIGLLSSISAKM